MDRSEAPELYREVDELAGRAGLPMPRLYLIPSEQPNAFATGRSPKKAAVAVTEGLLRHLPREQVRGVLAHELAHIKNRDVLVTTIAAMIGAAIAAVANFLQFSLLFGGRRRRRARSASSACSRRSSSRRSRRCCSSSPSRGSASSSRTRPRRSSSARAGRSPRRSARCERGVQAVPMQVNPATEALYIANPLSGRGMTALFSTHPPMEARIRRLRELDAAQRASTTSRKHQPWRRLRHRQGAQDSGPRRGSQRRGGDAGSALPELDLELSWSEAQLPERERTKHVHRLHPYLGKFVPQLVEALLDRYVSRGGRVLDPFAGSGTTLVQALESGYDASASTSPGSTRC